MDNTVLYQNSKGQPRAYHISIKYLHDKYHKITKTITLIIKQKISMYDLITL